MAVLILLCLLLVGLALALWPVAVAQREASALVATTLVLGAPAAGPLTGWARAGRTLVVAMVEALGRAGWSGAVGGVSADRALVAVSNDMLGGGLSSVAAVGAGAGARGSLARASDPAGANAPRRVGRLS